MYRSHRFLVCFFFGSCIRTSMLIGPNWSDSRRKSTIGFSFSLNECVCVCVWDFARPNHGTPLAAYVFRLVRSPRTVDVDANKQQNKTKNKTKHKIERSRRFQGRRNSCVVTHKHSKKNDRNRHFFSPQKVVLLAGKAMESVL